MRSFAAMCGVSTDVLRFCTARGSRADLDRGHVHGLPSWAPGERYPRWMSPIPWTRLSGEAVEDAVAMLLCAENFEATQVRPGRGDGGIDVFVPTSDDLSVREIYQVKRYSENLTSSQKRKIKRSLDQVVKTADDQGWTISIWRLVLPLNPTPNDLNWLSGLADEHPFPCRWSASTG
ncbi:restriction endonuclease [Rhodococcus opacus]|nr:restriction endonuclease [Rhodococcus opacus]